MPDLVLIGVVATAVLRGPVHGALVGLVAGWVVELVPPVGSPLGLTPLVHDARRPRRGALPAGVVAHRSAAPSSALAAAGVVVLLGRVASAIAAEGSVSASDGLGPARLDRGRGPARPAGAALRRPARSCAGGSDEARARPGCSQATVPSLVLLVSLFGLLVARLGAGPARPGRAADDAGRVGAHPHDHRARPPRADPRPHRRPARRPNSFTTVVTVERAVLLDADDGGRALVRSVAGVLGQPFDRLWGKTMLCGTAGAPRAPPASTARPTCRSRSPRASTRSGP